MAVIVELPAEIEERLRREHPNLDVDAKEAMFVGLYRQDKLSRYELSLALGLSRFESDGLLKKHKVTEGQLTAEEMKEDLRRARVLFSR